MLWAFACIVLFAGTIAVTAWSLAHLEDDSDEARRIATLLTDQHEAQELIGRRSTRDPLLWIGVIAGMGLPFGAIAPARELPALAAVPERVFDLAATGIAVLLVVSWTVLRTHRYRRQETRRLLRAAGYPTCLQCGYDLRRRERPLPGMRPAG